MDLNCINDTQRDVESGNAQEKNDSAPVLKTGSTEVVEQRIRKPLLLLFWQLIPFFRRVLLYFVIIALDNEEMIDLPLILRAILKCSPIMTLTIFIFRQFNSHRLLYQNKYALILFICHLVAIAGAIMVVFDSDIGDLFIIGKALYLVALALYTIAFGFRPFASRLFVRSLIAGCLGYYYLYLGAVDIFGQFNLTLKITSAFYIAVLLVMQWRAWARVSFFDLKQGRWFEFLGGMGASSLIIAESITLIDRFLKPVGATYYLLGANYSAEAFLYAGNFGIVLSVLDGPNVLWPQEQEAQSEKSKPFRSSLLCLGNTTTCVKNFVLGIMDWIFS